MMEFDNKTILISGLLVCAIVAMIFNYEQIALAIVAGLVGYLSKDKVDQALDKPVAQSDYLNDEYVTGDVDE